jgi:hypothetical protein
MIEAAASCGAGERNALILETLTAFKRAGATGVLTYHALDAARLASAVAQARGGTAEFNRLASRAEALAAAAGSPRSESWVVAQQALSALGAQHGVTTDAAADIDAVAADRIDATRWLVPATQAAIEAAAAEVGAINDAQRATIARLGARLGT